MSASPSNRNNKIFINLTNRGIPQVRLFHVLDNKSVPVRVRTMPPETGMVQNCSRGSCTSINTNPNMDQINEGKYSWSAFVIAITMQSSAQRLLQMRSTIYTSGPIISRSQTDFLPDCFSPDWVLRCAVHHCQWWVNKSNHYSGQFMGLNWGQIQHFIEW